MSAAEWADVVESLRESGLADWQIARGIAVIQSGGSVAEALAAIDEILPVPRPRLGD